MTAIVTGPNTLSPNAWLPKAWGGKNRKFKDLTELNRFVILLMGLYNDLALVFDQDPEAFRPAFYESKVDGRRVQIVDEGPERLKPIQLLPITGRMAGDRKFVLDVHDYGRPLVIARKVRGE